MWPPSFATGLPNRLIWPCQQGVIIWFHFEYHFNYNVGFHFTEGLHGLPGFEKTKILNLFRSLLNKNRECIATKLQERLLVFCQEKQMLAFLRTNSSKCIELNFTSINISGPEFSSEELNSAALSGVISSVPEVDLFNSAS